MAKTVRCSQCKSDFSVRKSDVDDAGVVRCPKCGQKKRVMSGQPKPELIEPDFEDLDDSVIALPPRRTKKKKKRKESTEKKKYADPFGGDRMSLDDRIRERSEESHKQMEMEEVYKSLIWPAIIVGLGVMVYAMYDPMDPDSVGGRLKPFVEAFGQNGIIVFYGICFLGSLIPPGLVLLERWYGTRSKIMDWWNDRSLKGKIGAGVAAVALFIGFVGGTTAIMLKRIEDRKSGKIADAPPPQKEYKLLSRKLQPAKKDETKKGPPADDPNVTPEDRTGVKLARAGLQFAFDSTRQRLAVLEYEPSTMTIYDTQNDFREVAQVETPAKPISIVFREWNGEGRFIVGGELDPVIRVYHSEDGKSLGDLRASLPTILDLASSQSQFDPYIYYVGYGQAGTSSKMEGHVGRFHLETLTDAGLGPSHRAEATDIAVSPDGELLYLRDQRITPMGFDCFRITEDSVQGSAFGMDQVHHEHRSGEAWVVSQDGFFVAEGKALFDRQLEKPFGAFEFPVTTFAERLPLAAGFDEGVFHVASATSRRTLGRYEFPEKWLQAIETNSRKIYDARPTGWVRERHRVSPIFSDEANRRFLICDRDRVLSISFDELNLPEISAPTFRVDVPTRVAVGEAVKSPVKTSDPATEVRLVTGPPGMTLEDGTLEWTPGNDGVGINNRVLIQATLGEERLELEQSIVVHRPKVALPFSARQVSLSQDGQRAVVLGEPISTERYPRPGTAWAKVAMVDVTTRKITAEAELKAPAVNVAITENRVFTVEKYDLASNADFCLREYSAESLEFIQESDLLPNIRVPISLHVVPGYGIAVNELGVALKDLAILEETVPKTARSYANPEAVSSRLLPDAKFWQGVRYDLDGNVQLIKNVRSIAPQRIWQLRDVYPQPAPQMWGKILPTQSSYQYRNVLTATDPSIARVATRSEVIAMSGIIPMVARTWFKSSERDQRPAVLCFDAATGKQRDALYLASPPNGYSRDPAALEIQGGVLATCYKGDLYFLSLNELEAENYHAGFRFRPAVKTHLVSSESPTRIEYELQNGKAPYTLKMEQAPLNVSQPLFSVEGTAIEFDPKSVRELAIEVLTRRLSRFRTTEIVQEYLSDAHSEFERCTGQKPAGFPVAFQVTMFATDADEQQAALHHVLLVDLPKSELISDLRKQKNTSAVKVLNDVDLTPEESSTKTDVTE